MATTKLTGFSATQNTLESALEKLPKKIQYLPQHQISVVGRVHRIYANARRTQIILHIDAPVSFQHQLIQKHKELLDTYLSVPTSIRCTPEGLFLKVVLPLNVEIDPLKEGMLGVFHIIMVHTPVMPQNAVKDILVYAEIFSEYEK